MKKRHAFTVMEGLRSSELTRGGYDRTNFSQSLLLGNSWKKGYTGGLLIYFHSLMVMNDLDSRFQNNLRFVLLLFLKVFHCTIELRNIAAYSRSVRANWFYFSPTPQSIALTYYKQFIINNWWFQKIILVFWWQKPVDSSPFFVLTDSVPS